MARLIVKSPYIKGGGAGGGPGGYLKYIGTREGVELLPAGYMEYMAERPRSHGLFGDEDNVDMVLEMFLRSSMLFASFPGCGFSLFE